MRGRRTRRGVGRLRYQRESHDERRLSPWATPPTLLLVHGLRVLQVGGPQGIALAQCLCFFIASPKAGSTWTVTPNGDGTAKVSPSIDWPEHFHETFDRAPIGFVDFHLRDNAYDAPTNAGRAHMTDEREPDATPETESTPEVVARDRGDRPEPAVSEPIETAADIDVSGTYIRPEDAEDVTGKDEEGDGEAVRVEEDDGGPFVVREPPKPEPIPVGETGAQAESRMRRDREALKAWEDEIPF
jgi:hypothetical protein